MVESARAQVQSEILALCVSFGEDVIVFIEKIKEMDMHKKVLFIINPVSGTRKANPYLTDMITLLSEKGFECIVQATTPLYSAEYIATQHAADVDLIICVGGDGTLNATVAGCLNVMQQTPQIGYIPSGSTNDFANSLSLPMNPLKCLQAILEGDTHAIDVGLLNERPFVYTASFGAFTKSSYTTPRDAKNNLGYMAYILEGVKELSELKPYHITFKTDMMTGSGDYIFGGICNSKRLAGGIVKFEDDVVDLNDGLFEVFLVKYPKNGGEAVQALLDLSMGNFDSPFIDFFSARYIEIQSDNDMDWTIDGEYQSGKPNICIKVLPSALQLRY